MDERYTNCFIDSVSAYLYKLQYLAVNNKTTLKDLSLLQMIKKVYDWAVWYEVSELDQQKLRKQMQAIVLSNSNIAMIPIQVGYHYSNVSSPQTIYTWQRLIDNPSTVTHESINLEILDEDGEVLTLEDGNVLQFEY